MGILKKTFKEFGEDDCPRMAAALAYYTVFALPPLLVLILMVAGLFVSPDEVMRLMQGQVSRNAAEQLQTMVDSANEKVSGGFSAALILSLLGLLFSASGAFAQLQSALNAAWAVEPDPEDKGAKKIIHILTKRFMSLGMIAVVAFLLIVTLILSGLIATFTESIAEFLGSYGLSGSMSTALVWAADAIVSITVLWLLFATIFKFLPDAKVQWKDVRVGALVTSILFVIGKIVIGWYIGSSDPGSAFGAAGSLAVILVFVYYASMIVLLGAEFTEAWATEHGHRVRPSKHAVRVVTHKEHIRDRDRERGKSSGLSDERSSRESDRSVR